MQQAAAVQSAADSMSSSHTGCMASGATPRGRVATVLGLAAGRAAAAYAASAAAAATADRAAAAATALGTATTV